KRHNAARRIGTSRNMNRDARFVPGCAAGTRAFWPCYAYWIEGAWRPCLVHVQQCLASLEPWEIDMRFPVRSKIVLALAALSCLAAAQGSRAGLSLKPGVFRGLPKRCKLAAIHRYFSHFVFRPVFKSSVSCHLQKVGRMAGTKGRKKSRDRYGMRSRNTCR